MKILLVPVLVTAVSLIHGSAAGCCSCKSTFNDLMAGLSKKVQNEFDLALENGSRPCSSDTANCPPCGSGTNGPSTGTPGLPSTPDSTVTSCPHLHPPSPADGVCRKFVFKDTGPEFVLYSFSGSTGSQLRDVVASGYDLFVFSKYSTRKWIDIQHYNRNQYCGLHATTKEPRPKRSPINFGSIDAYNGHLYGLEANSKTIFRTPIKPLTGASEWTKFLTVSTPTGHSRLHSNLDKIKWSEDGEKLFISLNGPNYVGVLVNDKNGKYITTMESCDKRFLGINGFSFDIDGNIQVLHYYYGICLYSKTNYKLIKRIKVRGGIKQYFYSGLYTHCDGSMIAIEPNAVVFMDKNYKITNVARNLGSTPGIYTRFAVTSDGYLNVLDNSKRQLIYKYKLY